VALPFIFNLLEAFMNQTCKLLLLIAAVSLSLPACSNKKQSDAVEQVAVRVNGQPIMAADFGVKPELAGAGEVLPVSASDMKLMIDLELLRQAAVESRLDLDEKTRAKIADSAKKAPKEIAKDLVNNLTRKALAAAYINKQISSIPAPTEAEMTAFFISHPARYAERKRYELQVCSIKPSAGKEAEIKAQLGKSKKVDDFERWLKAKKIVHGCVPVSVISDQAEDRLMEKLRDVPVGGSLVEGGNDQMTITFVRAMQQEPLTLAQARPQIMQMLMDKQKAESYRNMLKQLGDKAKIEYVPPYTAGGFQPLSLKPLSKRNDQYTTA
jgi:EpsD family peptidyl-prolyl cis-trans isomerase